MAEFVVSTLLNFVLDKVSSCIGVNEELKKLQSTLLTIQAVLEDAEARQPKEKSIKIWLRKLKDVTYDADDLLDRIVDEDRKIESSKRKKARHYLNSLTFRNDLARSIKEIRERLDEIAEERSMFHLQERVVVKGTKEDTGVLREETGSFVNESEVLGREKDKEKIVEFLINKSSGGDLGVLAIVGMGGLGKTTVAQVAYNNEKVCKDFDPRMWVCVSEDFDSKRIGRSIIESVTKSECKLQDMDSIQSSLVEKLQGKRFLLVLDDVWNENHEKWDRLRSLLCCCGATKGSKIIVTTRSERVASIMGTDPPHLLTVLSQDDCWTLFEKRAFGLGGANKTQNLVAIGKEIVKKCGGVPLAARALGSLVRFKKKESEWLTVKDSELWKLTDDKNDILPALTLSYNHLPSRLKQCFAYCSIFPKDYHILKETLVQLWIAEGFIQSSDEITNLDDIGFQYIDELLSRSLLENVDIYDDDTNVKMHDLVHDLARSVAGEECSIVDASTGKGFFQSSRYSSYLCSEDLSAILEPLNQANKLRTLRLIFSYATRTEEEQLQKLLYVIFSKLKILRVLHLSWFPIKGLPGSVRNLEHLRYLKLQDAKFETLPSCVGDLQNLLSLDLTGCEDLLSLPSSIGHLTSLRKLNLTYSNSLQVLPESIGDLHNLLTLKLRGCKCLLSLPSSIGRLTSLRMLDLYECKSLQALPESIGDLHHLLTLVLKCCEGLLSLPSSIGGLTSLSELNLDRNKSLQALPESTGDLRNILTLSLRSCKSLLSLPSSIGRLTSLQKLNLSNCRSLHALPESIGDLHNLLTLNLECCTSLQALPESVSSLQTLEKLDLWFCTKLVQLPENTSNMRSLLHFNTRGCFSLTSMPAGLGQLSHLRTLPRYVLDKEKKCSLGELGSLNLLKGTLKIYNLENVRNVAEARSANLREKHSLWSLKLNWNSSEPPEMQDRDGYVVDFQEDVLESLQPHTDLNNLHIDGYLGRKFPSWMLEPSLPNLVLIELSSCFRCECLPPFGQLPKLKLLCLRKLTAVKCLGSDFYGGDGAFPLLDRLYLESMPALKEWSGATATGGEIFPSLSSLTITDCPKLKALPSTFPLVTELEINADEGGSLLSALTDGAFSNLTCLGILNKNFGSFRDLPQVIKERMASIHNWTDAHLTQLNSIPLEPGRRVIVSTQLNWAVFPR